MEAHQALEVAYDKLPQRRAGWHSNARIFNVLSLVNMGQLAKLAARFPQLIAEADQRGDLYTYVNFRAGAPSVLLLAADQPEEARRQIREAMARWSQSGFLLQHWRTMCAEVDVELYEGDGPVAYERLSRDARALDKSLLLRVQYVRAMTSFLRARCAIASLEGASSVAPKRLAVVDKMARQLAREGLPWTSALASMVAAGAANAHGDRTATEEHLRAALERTDGAGMELHAAAARHRLGAVLGGEEGLALTQQAEDTLRAQGVRTPSRFASMLMPGRWP